MSWTISGENLNDDIWTVLHVHDLEHMQKVVLDALDAAGAFEKTWSEDDGE